MLKLILVATLDQNRQATLRSSLSDGGGDEGCVAEGGAHFQPRLMQPALEGGLADAGDLRCLACREPLDVAQHQGSAVGGSEAGDSRVEAVAELFLLGLTGRSIMCWRGNLCGLLVDRDRHAVS